MKLALIGALLLALSFPAYAQDNAQACVDTVDTASAAMSAAGVPFVIVDDADAVTAFAEYLAIYGVTAPEGVTRVFIATSPTNGAKYFGLEIGGCLTPPASLPVPKASA